MTHYTRSAVSASGTGALGDASHSSHQPDSWLAARTRNHLAAGATPCRCSITRDPRRRLCQALRRSARASDATEAGARSLANTNRRSRCHDQQGGCRGLVAIPGIGPVTATAIIAAIGNGAAFKKVRGFSAWLGIVPGEYTTGGKQKLLGISKRGNSYLRRLLVQGARAVLQQSAKQSSGLSAWLAQLTTRA